MTVAGTSWCESDEGTRSVLFVAAVHVLYDGQQQGTDLFLGVLHQTDDEAIDAIPQHPQHGFLHAVPRCFS
jgi:hypothetical protein